MSNTNAQTRAPRLEFVDRLRGLAVVFMILWHTADSWVRPDVREKGWDMLALQTLGGLAAPMFFMLAGVGAGVRTSVERDRGTDPIRLLVASLRRGLELIAIGYLLRVFMWTVDLGGIRSARVMSFLAPLALGWIAIWATVRGKESLRTRRAIGALVGGVAAVCVGVSVLLYLEPTKMIHALRIDVLQGMGGSLMLLALVERIVARRSSTTRIAMLLIGALSVMIAGAVLVPVFVSLNAPLPALSGYVVKLPPIEIPGSTPRLISLFPMFPWAGYALVGAVLGGWWLSLARDGSLERRLHVLSSVGLIVAVLGAEALAPARELIAAFPSLVHVVRVPARIGAVHVFASVAFHMRGPADRVLTRLGNASLLIYWVHLEFAYGLLAKPFHKKLDIAGWSWRFVVLVALMWLLAWSRDALTERRALKAKTARQQLRDA